MNTQLKIYNTLSRQKELFEPINPPFVGMYVCGPTVYSDVHLGNCRTFITFDVVYRYLLHLGYKVRYVRNITDMGHLENDADEGEDKIAKKARIEQIEPMEVVQRYTNGFREVMNQFNALPPSIEPTATGHVVEQIEMVQKILDNGLAYIKNGSVYFDVPKLIQQYPDSYGKLSGKVMDDLLQETRDLKNQDEKNNAADFAIWIKAAPQHLMHWNSPWSVGFPGWHLECSVMSTKYLGEQFDLHGGGMDLQFPHHENEIAQNVGCCGTAPVRYWMHGNMLTINGQKMSKSLGNSILPDELFEGNNNLMSQAYSPMTVRFFMMQTHYRSTLDFSDAALQAAEKGYKRLMNALQLLPELKHPGNTNPQNTAEDQAVQDACNACYEHINDDFNTAMVLADLFELSGKINSMHHKQLPADAIGLETFNRLQHVFPAFVMDILGLKDDTASGNNQLADGLMGLVLDLRAEARSKKDWPTSDLIRDRLKNLRIVVKDGKEGSTWSVE
jgi:cysteinyl-tRNA synthetase